MASYKLTTLTTVVCLALCVSTQAKRSEDVLPRPSRNKNAERDRTSDRQELFAGLKEPEPSAQGVSTAVSPYNQLGNQGLLNVGGAGIYSGGLGQTQNPYSLGLGGLGAGIQQNPYLGLGLGAGAYQQNPYLSGLGGAGGYQQNPYALAGIGGVGGLQNQYLGLQNPYGGGGIQDLYSQQALGLGGLGNQYLGGAGAGFAGAGGLNPYLFRSQGQGYQNNQLIPNNYLGQGSYLSQGLLNPYTSYGQLNPYNSYPLSSRFGLGLSRGVGSGRTSSSSQQTSNSDE